MSQCDLLNDTKLCPIERNALKSIYSAAKGQEWTRDRMWLDPYTGHCSWYGVECNDLNKTIKLELPNNGLSGTLDKDIEKLNSLEVLDLSDNDIKVGTILNLIKFYEMLRLTSYDNFFS